MKPLLSENDRIMLENRIAEAEKLTGSQIVIATVKRSDSYLEIPWKAFALCASFAGLLVFSLDLILFSWIQDIVVLISVVITLAVASLAVLFSVLSPVFARLFLSHNRAEAEVKQYAESLFLSRELFSTSQRTGMLLLISLFERKVIILPDKGLSENISSEDLKKIISQMKDPLAHNDIRRAIEIALDEFIRIIKPLPSGDGRSDELSNKIIEEKGL